MYRPVRIYVWRMEAYGLDGGGFFLVLLKGGAECLVAGRDCALRVRGCDEAGFFRGDVDYLFSWMDVWLVGWLYWYWYL